MFTVQERQTIVVDALNATQIDKIVNVIKSIYDADVLSYYEHGKTKNVIFIKK